MWAWSVVVWVVLEKSVSLLRLRLAATLVAPALACYSGSVAVSWGTLVLSMSCSARALMPYMVQYVEAQNMAAAIRCDCGHHVEL